MTEVRALTPALSFSFTQDGISLPWVLAGASTHSSGTFKAVLVDRSLLSPVYAYTRVWLAGDGYQYPNKYLQFLMIIMCWKMGGEVANRYRNLP